jgi:hypothetical protein
MAYEKHIGIYENVADFEIDKDKLTSPWVAYIKDEYGNYIMSYSDDMTHEKYDLSTVQRLEREIQELRNSTIALTEAEYDILIANGKIICKPLGEDVERENYLQAIAERYYIRSDDLRKLVVNYAAGTGAVTPVQRPKSGVQAKNTPEENKKRNQRLLLTWITDEPQLYRKIQKYISAQDFTEELYARVAQRMFADLEQGVYNPAAIINMFTDEEEQKEAASLFHTNLPRLETVQEREKAFRDILLAVKKGSYEYYTAKLGTDVNAIKQAIEGKKALEELARTHISLE